MNMFRRFAAAGAFLAMTSVGFAQTPPPIPPANAQKVSAIVTTIEARPDFGYIESIDWDDDGYYLITYHTSDKAKVEIKIDAVTGEPRD